MPNFERTQNFLDRMRATFHFETTTQVTENFHLVIKGLTDAQLEAAEMRLLKGAQSSKGFRPWLLPGDVVVQAEAAVPTEKKGLNPYKWKFGKDEEGRPLAWHQDMHTPEGEQYPQLTSEEIERAHPKLEPGGKPGAMASAKRIEAKVNQQEEVK